MSIAEHMHDEDEEELALGPSLAIPPLYVLRTVAYFPECSTAMHVYTLGCERFMDKESGCPIEDFHFLRQIERVPHDLRALLTTRCPGYSFDRDGTSGKPYLMNHCECGARLDDDYLHGDVGAAFWPDTPDGYAAFSLFELPFEEPIPIVCTYTLGGGEYLNLELVSTWRRPFGRLRCDQHHCVDVSPKIV